MTVAPAEETPEERLRRQMRENIESMSRKTEIVKFGSMDVELRELSYGKRMSLLRGLRKFVDTADGKAAVEKHEVEAEEYVIFAMVVEVAYFPDTDVKVWETRDLGIADLTDAMSDELEKISEATTRILGIADAPDTDDDAEPPDETEKNS